MRKKVLCVVLVLALVLASCASDDKPTSGFGLNGETSSQDNAGKSGDGQKNTTDTANATGTKDNTDGKDDSKSGSSDNATASKSDDSGVNAVGSEKTVTDAESDNVYNIGGIGFKIPEGMTQKNVFVGPCVTFESSKLGAVIYAWSYNLAQYEKEMSSMGEDFDQRADISDFVNGIKETNPSSSRYISESEFIGDDLLESAGYKGRKLSFKGMIDSDVYKDGPIKGKAQIIEDEIVIYNDSDDNVIMMAVLCRESAYENVNKLIGEMLSSAVSECTKPLMGSLDDRYLENGGFSFTIPACYGNVYSFFYDGYYQAYQVEYAKKDCNLAYLLGYYLANYATYPVEDIDAYQAEFEAEFGKDAGYAWQGDIQYVASDVCEDWLNVFSAYAIFTRTEFEETCIPTFEKWMSEFISPGFQKCETVSKERVSIDGMDGMEFKFNVTQNDQDYVLYILGVNNNKSRYISFITSMVKADGENLDAFDTLVSSMKNLSK